MSSSFSDSSTLRVSKLIDTIMSREVVHLSDTDLARSKSSSDSFCVSGNAVASEVAKDVHLSVNPLTGAIEQDAPLT